MNASIKPRLLLASAVIAAGSLLCSATAFADTGTPDDYFHTGAGARYLKRADSDLVVQPLRGNLTVLMGSGGNVTVLSGKEGKFLVDAGISKSQEKMQAALNKISPAPLKYVVNTHWHWDHTDGDAWMHAAGATIVAHKNTFKHLTETTHVNAWNWTFDPVPAGARPTLLIDQEKTFNFAGTKIEVENFGHGHTDGDLWIYFKQADVLALGDTFWNGIYPYIDNEDGGDIDGAITWADKAVARTTDHTIVVPGHGAVGTRADLIAFRDMLVTVRNNVATLKQQGKSLDEIIAAKPTAAFDAKWGNFVFNGDQFTKMVYAGIGVSGIGIPDSALTRDATQLIRDTEGDLLFQHSLRVYYWAALAGKRDGLTFDPELLYVAAMFHDFGVTARYGQSHLRYEVDGANAARDFLRSHGKSEADAEKIWLAIALHTTNGVSPHLFPLAALVAAGANMDLVGAGYDDFTAAQRNAVELAHPHPPQFAEDFMQTLYDSLKHRPETTQGTGLADILAYKDPLFVRRDFSALMRKSHWAAAK